MSENLELSVTRYIDAPPQTVYRVYTERTAEWWMPKPWTTPAVDWDLRTGGRMYTEMRSPEGDTDGGEGVFLEVVPGERIVWTNAFKPGWQPQVLSNEGCDFPMVAIINRSPAEKSPSSHSLSPSRAASPSSRPEIRSITAGSRGFDQG